MGPIPGDQSDWITCPHCGATTGSRAIWTVSNAVRGVLNGLALVFQLLFAMLDVPILGEAMILPLPVRRRCTHCHGLFYARAVPPEAPECGQCGYDLTGNVSGVCPECGWALTRRMKRRVRMQAGLAQRGARRKSDVK